MKRSTLKSVSFFIKLLQFYENNNKIETSWIRMNKTQGIKQERKWDNEYITRCNGRR